MGKHQTYRHRGGGRTPAGGLGPPGQPLLQLVGDDAVQYATTGPDVAGTIELQGSNTDSDPWTSFFPQAWNTPHVWGPALDFGYLFLRANETGNGINYIGTSAWSASLATGA